MSGWKKGVIWIMGLLTWVFALSIGLGWYNFGYLDVGIITMMLQTFLFPVLLVGVVLIVIPEKKVRPKQSRYAEVPLQFMETRSHRKGTEV
ncbi:MAG: hypothetical protein HY606_14735 [Planctomycetes bacterium]|nr:hypothetical protein [Planctomycetota bacterium]